MSKCNEPGCDCEARESGLLCWQHTMGLVLHTNTLQDFTTQSSDIVESVFDAQYNGEPSSELFSNLMATGAKS